MIEKKLVEMLICPKCKGTLDFRKVENCLACQKCKIKYKIIDGDIPDMLIEDAENF